MCNVMCNVMDYVLSGDCGQCIFEEYGCGIASKLDTERAERLMKHHARTGRVWYSEDCSFEDAMEDAISRNLDYDQVSNEVRMDFGIILSRLEFDTRVSQWHKDMEEYYEKERMHCVCIVCGKYFHKDDVVCEHIENIGAAIVLE